MSTNALIADFTALKIKAQGNANPDNEIVKLEKLVENEIKNALTFLTQRDAKLIHYACRGIGKDDELLIEIIGNRTKRQLYQIDEAYVTMPQNISKRTVKEKLDSELSGNYSKFSQYLFERPGNFASRMLHAAMDGIGCNNELLNEIFFTLSNEGIKEMKQAYEANSGFQKLADRLRSELSGQHLNLIINVLANGRPEGGVDQAKAEEDVEALYTTISTDKNKLLGGLSDAAEAAISEILLRSSPEQCREIRKLYEIKHPQATSLEEVIRTKVGGGLKSALLFMLRDPLDIYCIRLHDATSGITTNEETISRIIGGNDKIVVESILQRYKENYGGQDFRNVIHTKTGRDYRTALTSYLTNKTPLGDLNAEKILYSSVSDGSTTHRLDALIAILSNVHDFIASLDADLLHLAVRGVTKDERLINFVLGSRTKVQLDRIDEAYRSHYKISLREFISKNVGGNLQEFLTYIQMAEEEFDAVILRNALTKSECDKRVVLEIVCTRSHGRLLAARAYYSKFFDKEMLDDMRSALNGLVKLITLRIMDGVRTRPIVVADKYNTIERAADILADELRSNKEAFIDSLLALSSEDIEKLKVTFESRQKKSLENAIRSEFTDPFEQLGVVALIQDSIEFYCRELKDAFSGFFATSSAVNRIIGGNDKATANAIAKRYNQKYNEDLIRVLNGGLSGDYRAAVVSWVLESDYTGQIDLNEENANK